jgi:hypothetical protein
LALPALFSIRASNKLHNSEKSTMALRSSSARSANPGALPNNHCMLMSGLNHDWFFQTDFQITTIAFFLPASAKKEARELLGQQRLTVDGR